MTDKTTMFQFLQLHFEKKDDGLRLGQRFCNMYVKESWPELYYESEVNTAIALIYEWLERYNYLFELPPEIDRINLPH